MLDFLLTRPYIAVSLGLLVAWWLYSRVSEELKIRRLGGHAGQIRSWVPFGSSRCSKSLSTCADALIGIHFVWEGVAHGLRDENLKFWHKNFQRFGKPQNRYTTEARTAGLRIVFTADPENIKAILATQFNDFGKGEEFNKDFHHFLGNGTSIPLG